MTVAENLLMGAHLRRRGSGVPADIDAAYARFRCWPSAGTRRRAC